MNTRTPILKKMDSKLMNSLLMIVFIGFCHSSFALEKEIQEKREKSTIENNNILTNDDKVLFVQSTIHAVIEKNAKEPGHYTITLHNISPYVTYFTDRPSRKTGIIPIQKMLKLWQIKEGDSFKNDPPNANISAFLEEDTTNHQLFNFTVVLTDPIYDGKTKTLKYTMKLLESAMNHLPDGNKLNHVIVLIDSVCLNCWFP